VNQTTKDAKNAKIFNRQRPQPSEKYFLNSSNAPCGDIVPVNPVLGEKVLKDLNSKSLRTIGY